MRRTFLLFPLFSAGTAFPQTLYQVTFKPVTAFGEPVAAHITVLADPLHRRDLASHCAGLVCTGVPEGPYTYSISLDGTGRKVDASAVVYRPNQIVTIDVGTPAGELDEEAFPSLQGKIMNAAEPLKVWVRLQPLYSDSSVSARIEKDGSFNLGQVRPGNWMLLVLAEGKLLHFEPFTCLEKDNPPIIVKLASTKPVMKVERTRTDSAGQ